MQKNVLWLTDPCDEERNLADRVDTEGLEKIKVSLVSAYADCQDGRELFWATAKAYWVELGFDRRHYVSGAQPPPPLEPPPWLLRAPPAPPPPPPPVDPPPSLEDRIVICRARYEAEDTGYLSLISGDRLLLAWHQCEFFGEGNLYPCYVYGTQVDKTSAYGWFPWDLVVLA